MKVHTVFAVVCILVTVALQQTRANCEHETWGVMTTIFAPTSAAEAWLRYENVCLVVVGDEKTPGDLWREIEATRPNAVYLSPGDQIALGYRILEWLPWNHFARKNVGYLYAFQQGAVQIFDFDDDNVIDAHNSTRALHVWKLINRDTSLRTVNIVTNVTVFNPYPMFEPVDGEQESVFCWARGVPLETIREQQNWYPSRIQHTPLQDIKVVQMLANHDPDLDAIYRLTRPLPVYFRLKFTAVMPKNTFVPINAQATLWHRDAMDAMLLPASVHGRVSDIWRGYVANRLLWSRGHRIAFTWPHVTQHRNAHSYIQDFHAEQPLYSQTKDLISLLQHLGDEQMSIEGAHRAMEVAGLAADTRLAEAWARDIAEFGSTPSTPRKSITAFRRQTDEKMETPTKQPGTPKVDTVVSTRTSAPDYEVRLRDFYNAWLTYWPPLFGEMVVLLDDQKAADNVQQCFARQDASMCGAPRAAVVKAIQQKREYTQKTIWKFTADLVSDADAIAFFDDDACLINHVIPSDIFTRDNRIILKYADKNTIIAKHRDLKKHAAAFNIQNGELDNMIDFPIVVWRDMLRDFRAHVNHFVYGVESVASVSLFASAYEKIATDNHIYEVCEFCLLAAFALTDTRWKEKYQAQIFTTGREDMLTLSRHHFTACAVPTPQWKRDENEFVQNVHAMYPWDSNNWETHESITEEVKHARETRKNMIPGLFQHSEDIKRFLDDNEREDVAWSERCPGVTERWKECFQRT